MAVATTVQDVITGAYSHSKKNAAGRVITEATEGLQIVTRALRGLYAVGARINPEFFSTSALNVVYSSGWARPQDAELIYAIEIADGTPVNLVPRDERTVEPLQPAVYLLGQVYHPAGNANDPDSGDTLSFFYSKRPAQPANLAATLDALWCEAYNELLYLEVAIYIALKDGRMDEAAALKPERDRWATLYVAFLEHSDSEIVRRFDRTFKAPSLVSLASLFAGGSSAVKR